ncbi:unnamed protein product, partial [Laminaria digitata]
EHCTRYASVKVETCALSCPASQLPGSPFTISTRARQGLTETDVFHSPDTRDRICSDFQGWLVCVEDVLAAEHIDAGGATSLKCSGTFNFFYCCSHYRTIAPSV